MFNDFKLLSFDSTKQKILRLKDIFDRLSLSSLEKRLIELENVLSVPNLTFAPVSVSTPPEPTDLPDLAVIDISYQLIENYYEFSIAIQNVGLIATPESTVLIFIPDFYSSIKIVPSLDIEERTIIKFQRSYDSSKPYVLKYISAEVNPSRILIEKSYLNNIGYSLTSYNFYPFWPDYNGPVPHWPSYTGPDPVPYYIAYINLLTSFPLPNGGEFDFGEYVFFTGTVYNHGVPSSVYLYSHYSLYNPETQEIDWILIGQQQIQLFDEPIIHDFVAQWAEYEFINNAWVFVAIREKELGNIFLSVGETTDIYVAFP